MPVQGGVPLNYLKNNVTLIIDYRFTQESDLCYGQTWEGQLCRTFLVDLTAGANTRQEVGEGTMYQSLSLGHEYKLNGTGGKHFCYG